MSLLVRFRRAQAAFLSRSESSPPTDVAAIVRDLLLCERLVESGGIFEDAEEVDDVSTKDLKQRPIPSRSL
jgi:hypothetical protein